MARIDQLIKHKKLTSRSILQHFKLNKVPFTENYAKWRPAVRLVIMKASKMADINPNTILQLPFEKQFRLAGCLVFLNSGRRAPVHVSITGIDKSYTKKNIRTLFHLLEDKNLVPDMKTVLEVLDQHNQIQTSVKSSIVNTSDNSPETNRKMPVNNNDILSRDIINYRKRVFPIISVISQMADNYPNTILQLPIDMQGIFVGCLNYLIKSEHVNTPPIEVSYAIIGVRRKMLSRSIGPQAKKNMGILIQLLEHFNFIPSQKTVFTVLNDYTKIRTAARVLFSLKHHDLFQRTNDDTTSPFVKMPTDILVLIASLCATQNAVDPKICFAIARYSFQASTHSKTDNNSYDYTKDKVQAVTRLMEKLI